MGEQFPERSSGDGQPEKSVDMKGQQSPSPQGSSPLSEHDDHEDITIIKTERPRSTRESTMTDGSDDVKKERSSSSEIDVKSGRGSSSAKNSRRTSPLFDHLPSATEEATKTFQVIETSIYTSRYLGDSGQDEVMSCDCRPSWGELKRFSFFVSYFF